ncbi:hypothetical protein CC80DRAFT_469046 [Byssothecium circinans]|uniref:BTB domain-containing protein n=1 Tax=Byssothecium circinans TaxID=147558 RepID=A0A6A5TZ74_9PLEO|nr:hypothetical protein CC80DRAFT_469046 [Byssothecium circinans]
MNTTNATTSKAARLTPAPRPFKQFKAGHIAATVEDIRNLRDGEDIMKWSPSLRKTLDPALWVPVNLPMSLTGTKSTYVLEEFYAPKLAMVVTSPVLRSRFEEKPDTEGVKLENSLFTPNAVGVICKWLTDTCVTQEPSSIPMSTFSIEETLDIRAAALMLQMDQYVTHITEKLVEYFRARKPVPTDAELVCARIASSEDPVLVALVERVYACGDIRVGEVRHLGDNNTFSQEEFETWDKIKSGDEKFTFFLKAFHRIVDGEGRKNDELMKAAQRAKQDAETAKQEAEKEQEEDAEREAEMKKEEANNKAKKKEQQEAEETKKNEKEAIKTAEKAAEIAEKKRTKNQRRMEKRKQAKKSKKVEDTTVAKTEEGMLTGDKATAVPVDGSTGDIQKPGSQPAEEVAQKEFFLWVLLMWLFGRMLGRRV